MEPEEIARHLNEAQSVPEEEVEKGSELWRARRVADVLQLLYHEVEAEAEAEGESGGGGVEPTRISEAVTDDMGSHHQTQAALGELRDRDLVESYGGSWSPEAFFRLTDRGRSVVESMWGLR